LSTSVKKQYAYLLTRKMLTELDMGLGAAMVGVDFKGGQI